MTKITVCRLACQIASSSGVEVQLGVRVECAERLRPSARSPGRPTSERTSATRCRCRRRAWPETRPRSRSPASAMASRTRAARAAGATLRYRLGVAGDAEGSVVLLRAVPALPPDLTAIHVASSGFRTPRGGRSGGFVCSQRDAGREVRYGNDRALRLLRRLTPRGCRAAGGSLHGTCDCRVPMAY